MAISHLPFRSRNLPFTPVIDPPSLNYPSMNPIHTRGRAASSLDMPNHSTLAYSTPVLDVTLQNWQRQLCCDILKHSTVNINVLFNLIMAHVKDPEKVFEQVPLPYGCRIEEAREFMLPILRPQQQPIYAAPAHYSEHSSPANFNLPIVEPQVLPPMDISSHKRRSTETLQSPSIKKQALNSSQITLPPIHTMIERSPMPGPAPPPDMVRPEAHHYALNEVYAKHQRTPSSPRAHHHQPIPPRPEMLMSSSYTRQSTESYPPQINGHNHISGSGSTRSPTPVATPTTYSHSEMKTSLQTPTPALSPAIKPSLSESNAPRLWTRPLMPDVHRVLPQPLQVPISPYDQDLRMYGRSAEGHQQMVATTAIHPVVTHLVDMEQGLPSRLVIQPPMPDTNGGFVGNSVSPTTLPIATLKDVNPVTRRRRGRPRKEPTGLIATVPRAPRCLQPRPPTQTSELPPPVGASIGPRRSKEIIMPKTRRQSARGARVGGRGTNSRSDGGSNHGSKPLKPQPGEDNEDEGSGDA